MLLYCALIINLSILSMRISSFVMMCGRVLAEVGLFLILGSKVSNILWCQQRQQTRLDKTSSLQWRYAITWIILNQVPEQPFCQGLWKRGSSVETTISIDFHQTFLLKFPIKPFKKHTSFVYRFETLQVAREPYAKNILIYVLFYDFNMRNFMIVFFRFSLMIYLW